MTINVDNGKIDKECELNRSYGCCGCEHYYDESERIRTAIIHFISHTPTVSKGIIGKETMLAWLEKQGNNDTLDDEAYRKAYYDGYNKCNRDWIYSQEAEKEKYDFVSGQFIECRKSFNEFKEDNSYWLEYIGDDTYVGRSDNVLNQKFHITPRQLFTLFTQQHRPKEDSNVNDETNTPTGYGKYVDECLNEASKHFFSEGEDKYSVADLFYAGVRCGKSWLENQSEQKPAWSEEDERILDALITSLNNEVFAGRLETLKGIGVSLVIDWLKSIKTKSIL